jgi:mannosyltransferase
MTSLLTRPLVAAPERAALPTRPRRRGWLAPVIIGAIGFLLSFIGSWIPSVWYDEAATITSATRSWGQLWSEIHTVDAVHGVYYAFMHVVFDAFGYSPLVLRLPSSIAVGATAAIIVILVRRVNRPQLAVVAGLLFCIIPRVTWMGGEGRSYAISALLAASLTLVLSHAIESRQRRWWLLYGGLVLVSCAIFVYLALVVLAHGIGLAIAVRRGHSRGRAGLWFLGSVAAAGILLSPLLALVRGERNQISWIAPISKQTVQQVYLTQWFWGTDLFPAIAWVLMAVGTVALLRRRSGSLAMLVLPALIVPTGLLIAISALWEPLYSPRYLSMCTPFVAIAMAAGLDLARRRWVAAIVLVVLAGIALPHVVTVQRAPEAKKESSWSQVADLITRERAADGAATRTAIIYGPVRHHATATTRVIEYAYPTAFAGTTDVTLKTPAAESGALWETHRSLAASVDRLAGSNVAYLITSVKQDRRPSTIATLTPLGWHLDHSWRLTDVNVLRFVRS